MQEHIIAGLSLVAHPEPGGPLLPRDLWTAWAIEPSVWIPLVLSILIYGWGTYNI